ncbi:TolC family protein [Myroides guanonis]|uniref:Outer membrane protein TolC n=1 Tax=Myroides guanonis TaxID=1150112 RepID=A0A1I3KZS9_9FLAO|nr:TolC family protein [Myroides guanonis]SFI78031.1 Outer membrane protein TolC [Myroides guanonis]
MIKHIMATALLWLALVETCSIYAQQQTEKHTLGNLWPKVEDNYPGIRSKMAAIDASKLNEKAVKSARLPQIKAQLQNTYGSYEGSSGAFFSQPGMFNVNGSTFALEGSSAATNSFGSATIELELFSFGKLHKQNEAAEMLYNKAISEKDAYLLNLKKILSTRYIALLYNETKLNWTEKNVERLDLIRKITSGLSASGLRPAADSLLASSSYMQVLGDFDKWEGFKNASIIKLLELYGEEIFDYTSSIDRFNNPPIYNLYQRDTVSLLHPILESLDNQSEYYSLSGKVLKRESLPSINLMGGYAYRGTGINPDGTVSNAWKDGFGNTTNNYLVGIGITWNITNLRTNNLKGEALIKEAESAKLLHTQYKQAMQADLSASQAKILHQYEQLQKANQAVNQAQNAYEMYLARYKSGLITLSELLQIQLLLEQAESSHIEASLDYWTLLAYEAELTADFDFLFNNL